MDEVNFHTSCLLIICFNMNEFLCEMYFVLVTSQYCVNLNLISICILLSQKLIIYQRFCGNGLLIHLFLVTVWMVKISFWKNMVVTGLEFVQFWLFGIGSVVTSWNWYSCDWFGNGLVVTSWNMYSCDWFGMKKTVVNWSELGRLLIVCS